MWQARAFGAWQNATTVFYCFQFHSRTFATVSYRFIRKLIIVLLALPLLFEGLCWAFFRYPVEPVTQFSLNNEIPGFQKNVKIATDRHQVRYLDWTEGEKPAGAVRIFVIGGWATWGLLQNAEDTWWGRMHKGLKDAGLNVQTASRGFERTGILAMAAGVDSLVERLKPDILLVNTGFDDVIIHPLTYTYDKDLLSKLPSLPRDSSFKKTVFSVSQIVRFYRNYKLTGQSNQHQNQWGRSNYFNKYFEGKREEISRVQYNSVTRDEEHDPLPEFFDGLKAFAALADRHKAKLVLTGEAALQDSTISEELVSQLMAYVPLESPKNSTEVHVTRPNPGWVWREMRRYATASEKFATENGIPYFNLNDKVARKKENFFTDVMLTDAGAAEAASALLPFMTPIVKEKSGK